MGGLLETADDEEYQGRYTFGETEGDFQILGPATTAELTKMPLGG